MARVYAWKYGENGAQRYYEAQIGKDHLCVYANNGNPNTWMALCCGKLIYNKTRNDRYRKKMGLERGCPIHKLSSWAILCGATPEYMMKKVIWCYEHNLREISQ